MSDFEEHPQDAPASVDQVSSADEFGPRDEHGIPIDAEKGKKLFKKVRKSLREAAAYSRSVLGTDGWI